MAGTLITKWYDERNGRVLRRNGWDDINRNTGCNRFNPTHGLADKTNKKVKIAT